MRITLLLLACLLACVAVAEEAKNVLPLDLAYTMKTLGKEDNPAVSPDGQWIVYGVYTPPVKSPGSEMKIEPRFLPGGTPSINVGSRLFLTNTEKAASISVCPEKGNCWRPSWSHDSSKVVFYSDAGGSPQLWLYDMKDRKPRKVSDAKIKAKLWTGDEPYFSPEDAKVYIPIAPPDVKKDAPAAPAAAGTENVPSGIRTYSSGKELKEDPAKDKQAQNYMEFFLQENNASLSSIEIDSGKVQEIVAYSAEPRPSCLTLSPSGKWIAYLSVYRINDLASSKAFYDLAVVPTAGGPVHVVATDLEVNEIDYYGLAYRWHPSKDQFVYYKDKKLWLHDLKDPKSKSKQLAAELGEIAPFPMEFTNDGASLLVGIKTGGQKGLYRLLADATCNTFE